MSTASPPPPHDPPAGSGASPAGPPGGSPQPIWPTSYETPGYEPLFDPTRPPPEGGQSKQSPTGYPQQDLLPQDVKPGRSRKPLVIGLVVLALVAGGIAVVLLVLRGDGESTREAYCTAIAELAPDDDLIGAISNADTTTLDRARELPGLAPVSVADDWKTIEEVLTSASQASPQLSPTMFLQAYGALQSIIDDSNKNCGTAYELLPSP